MSKIIVEIDEAGETTVKVEGHAGPGCQKLSEAIEKALGSVTGDVKTREFTQAAKQTNQAKANQ